MDNIFDIVGDKFFLPLVSKNKKIYINIIVYLYELISELDESEENDDEKIKESLSRHLEDNVFNIDYEEDMGEGESKSSYFIKNLKRYGWIFAENQINNSTSLNFPDYTYSFIKFMQELIQNTKRQPSGYIKQIRSAIFPGFSFDDIDSLEIVYNSLEDLTIALKSLHSNIQRYYRNITTDKTNIELETLLKHFIGEYKTDFLDKSYFNLKTRDNIDTEIPRILERMEEIFSNHTQFDKMIESIISKDKSEQEAFMYLHNMKTKIRKNLKSIPVIINGIDNKNQKYVNRTISVLLHLINRGEDIEGILNRIIEFVKPATKDEYFDFTIFFTTKHYDYSSMYSPKAKKVKTVSEPLKFTTNITQDDIDSSVKNLLSENKYSIKEVNNFVDKYLDGNKFKEIKLLDIESEYEIIMIISIIVNSALEESIYNLEYHGERVKKYGVSFDNFTIRRKYDK